MKSIYSNLLLTAIVIITFSACASQSHVYVSERPHHPVMMQPGPPYAGAVWIPEEYTWRGGRYEYIAPHYVRSRRARVWVPGYWNNGHRGSAWVKGYWKR